MRSCTYNGFSVLAHRACTHRCTVPTQISRRLQSYSSRAGVKICARSVPHQKEAAAEDSSAPEIPSIDPSTVTTPEVRELQMHAIVTMMQSHFVRVLSICGSV